MIHAIIVGAHRRVAGAKNGEVQGIGCSKGGWMTKILATVGASGNPEGFHRTPGQARNLASAAALLPGIPVRRTACRQGL